MSNNKITTYLLYAIGEIVLVVVGILIAIQIDDWNQQRANSSTVKNLLTNLKAEQEFNLKYLETSKTELSSTTNSGLALLRAIEAKTILDERTTDSLVYRLITTNSTNLSQGAMLDIISTGKVELIRNDTLRSLILSLGSKIEDIRELQRLNNELLNANAIPYLYEHFAYTKMDSRFNIFDVDWPKGRFDSNLNHIFNDRKFESLLDDIIYRHLTVGRDTDALIKEIEFSLRLINRELNN